jgi:hypothetical protein
MCAAFSRQINPFAQTLDAKLARGATMKQTGEPVCFIVAPGCTLEQCSPG